MPNKVVTGDGPKISFKWENATRSTKYLVAQPGANAFGADLAADVGDYPLGVIQSDVPQNGHVSVQISGVSYAVAGGAISAGDRLAATTGGKVIADAARGNPSAVSATTPDYIVGRALSDAAADGDYVTMFIRPMETIED